MATLRTHPHPNLPPSRGKECANLKTAETLGDFPTRLSVLDARALLIEVCAKRQLDSQVIALDDALGRVVAEDIFALRDVPGFANSAMDGYAVRAADLSQSDEIDFRLIGQMYAGTATSVPIASRECVRITTGAPLPPGADTVVIKESVRVAGDRVWIGSGHRARENTRPVGEDYRTGDLALPRGTKIGPAELGVLAELGRINLCVTRGLRAVLLTTGDELIAPGQELRSGQIYDSNRYSIGALLQQYGVESLRHEHVSDNPEQLRTRLLSAAGEADIVLTSGGVSAGEADFLPSLLQEIGKIYLWKVRIKPGMPFLFGEVDRALVFALPGNPVSGIATFLTLVRSALDTLCGCRHIGIKPWRARLEGTIHKSSGRTDFQRAVLHFDEEGVLWARPFSNQGSGVLRSVAETDGLIVLPEQISDFQQGGVVEVLPLRG